MKSVLQISGMTCEGCKSSVQGKLGSLDGVDNVQVELATGEAVIYSKNPISLSLIKETLPPKFSLINEEVVNLDTNGDLTVKESKIKQLKPLFIIIVVGVYKPNEKIVNIPSKKDCFTTIL